MRFVLYTEKTPAQALSALNARLQARESASRAGLDGWIEKSGGFALSVSSPVVGRFSRRTVMQGKIERENGVTLVRGDVASGVERQGQIIVFVALALLALILFLSGNVAPALLIIPLGAYLYIPMNGDLHNSTVLMNELQRTLKARQTPPKRTDAPSSARASGAARSTGTAKAVSARPAGTARSVGAARTTGAKSSSSGAKPAASTSRTTTSGTRTTSSGAKRTTQSKSGS